MTSFEIIRWIESATELVTSTLDKPRNSSVQEKLQEEPEASSFSFNQWIHFTRDRLQADWEPLKLPYVVKGYDLDVGEPCYNLKHYMCVGQTSSREPVDDHLVGGCDTHVIVREAAQCLLTSRGLLL